MNEIHVSSHEEWNIELTGGGLVRLSIGPIAYYMSTDDATDLATRLDAGTRRNWPLFAKPTHGETHDLIS